MSNDRSLRGQASDLGEAVAVLRAAKSQGLAAVLESPPRVVFTQGAAWFLALADEARRQVPGVRVLTLVDAADAPGLAHDALARGADIVRFSGNAKAASRLKAIAEAMGRTLEIKLN